MGQYWGEKWWWVKEAVQQDEWGDKVRKRSQIVKRDQLYGQEKRSKEVKDCERRGGCWPPATKQITIVQRGIGREGGSGCLLVKMFFPQMQCLCTEVLHESVFVCNLPRQIPLQPKQGRAEKKRESHLYPNPIAAGRGEWSEGGRGGERRRRRRCNSSEGLQEVLAEHDCCLCESKFLCLCAMT